MVRAVFLDRDGTINEHVGGYVKGVDDFRIMPDALEALRLLSETEYKVIVVTNQSAVGRGLMSLDALEEIHEGMLSDVQASGGRIDAVYVCAHKPGDGCGCRKPKTGLVDLACETYDIDLGGSWFVGDKTVDIKTGENSETGTILVRTGYGGSDGLHDVSPDYTVDDLLEAAGIILEA
jgi:histidinol-phosphate phosphatase family protein